MKIIYNVNEFLFLFFLSRLKSKFIRQTVLAFEMRNTWHTWPNENEKQNLQKLDKNQITVNVMKWTARETITLNKK